MLSFKTALYLWTCCLTAYNLYYEELSFVQFQDVEQK